MDYYAPPSIERLHSYEQEHFIIEVKEASYADKLGQATIRMDEAYQKSYNISGYDGEYVTLIYKGSQPDLQQCPEIKAHSKDITRDISFINNEVSITISNVSGIMAKTIAQSLCFLINTETAKEFSAPIFTPAEKQRSNTKNSFKLND